MGIYITWKMKVTLSLHCDPIMHMEEPETLCAQKPGEERGGYGHSRVPSAEDINPLPCDGLLRGEDKITVTFCVGNVEDNILTSV